MQAGIREGGTEHVWYKPVRLRVQRGAWLMSKWREGMLSHRLVERTAECQTHQGEDIRQDMRAAEHQPKT